MVSNVLNHIYYNRNFLIGFTNSKVRDNLILRFYITNKVANGGIIKDNGRILSIKDSIVLGVGIDNNDFLRLINDNEDGVRF